MEHLSRILTHPIMEVAGGHLTLASLLLGLLIMGLGRAAAMLAERAVRLVLDRRGANVGAQFAASKFTRYGVLVVALYIAASTVGLNVTALLAPSAALLVGVGLGLQSLFQNVIAGLVLLIEQPIRRGDFVQVGGSYGVVEDIGLRATRVLTRDQVLLVVPNSDFISEKVMNHSQPSPRVRIAVDVGVAYGSDTGRVRAELLRVAGETEGVLAEPPPEVRFQDFGASSLAFTLLAWTDQPALDQRVKSALRFGIDAAFRAAGVEIAFPQLDVHLRSMPARAAEAPAA